MHLVYPQNNTWPLASISLEIDSNTQEELEVMLMQIFFGGGGGGGGALWSMWKWWMAKKINAIIWQNFLEILT